MSMKGRYTCSHCSDRFNTKGRRDTHVRNEHSDFMWIGDLLVTRKSHGKKVGFACPNAGCRSISKNVRTFGSHLDNHGIAHSTPAPASSSTPSSSAGPALSTRSASTPSSSAALPAPSRESAPVLTSSPSLSTRTASTPCSFTESATTSSSSTASPAPLRKNAILDCLNGIALNKPSNSLTFDNVDLAKQFYEFQIACKNMALDAPLQRESQVQHILALSSILLLKPGRLHPDMYKYISRETCLGYHDYILKHFGIGDQVFPKHIKTELEDIVHKMGKDPTRLSATIKITALIQDDVMSPVNKILLSVRNCVETLPENYMESGPMETELITRYLQASLVPLFEDLKNNVMYRWTSMGDTNENGRPDAVISIIDGASFDKTIGYGEVKPEKCALAHHLVNQDLVRIAQFSKDASDANRTTLTFAFLVVGNHVTFYLLHRAGQTLYTLSEIDHVQLPMTIKEIPLYLSQLNTLVKVIAAFECVVSASSHGYHEHPATLNGDQLSCVIDPKTSRKRKSVTSHYHH